MPKTQPETPVRKRAVVRFSRRGYVLFRYANGLLFTKEGYPVKLGVPGVSDNVGYRSRVIQPQDVGRTVAVFTAHEVKQGKGRLREEQHRFLKAVQAAGGEAWVTVDEEDMEYCGEDTGKRKGAA